MDIQKRLINFVSDWSPWLATIPTAWTVGFSVYHQFEWPIWVAGSAGIAIEFLGLACNSLLLDLIEWNQTKHKSEATAPVWLSAVLAAVYFAAVIFLTAVLERNAALATFPVLSLVATANLALKSNQKSRVASALQVREEERQEREKIKAEKLEAKRAKVAESEKDEQPISAVQEFVCPECGKKLSKQVSLDAHMEWHRRKEIRGEENMPI